MRKFRCSESKRSDRNSCNCTIVYKRCSRGVSKSLNQVFYKIKQNSVFPGIWKNSIVVPTYKKGCKSDVENYRRVSFLTIASKIFERCLFTCLYGHLEPIFHQAQYGFRKCRSCALQLLVYLESIYKSVDSKENIDMIYTDYGKAFDNVDHGILLTKLFNLGLRRKIIKLLQFYLIGRTQRVRINSHFSEGVKVTSGVPQGSLLASLFFVIYVTNLPETCRAVVPLICADDAKFISVNKSSFICQMDLTRVMKWSEQYKFPINVEKCSLILISNSMHHFSFSKNLIQKVHIQKDLGIYSTCDLKLVIHIKRSANKALGVLFFLKRSRKAHHTNLTPPVELNLYKNRYCLFFYTEVFVGLLM